MGIFDIINKPTKKEVLNSILDKNELAHESSFKPIDPPKEEPLNEEPNIEESDDVEEPSDLTILANNGSEMDISNYMDTDYNIDIIIKPQVMIDMGNVTITGNISDDEDVENIITLSSRDYKLNDQNSLKSAIKESIKEAKQKLDDKKTAFDSLNDYLDEIEDEI